VTLRLLPHPRLRLAASLLAAGAGALLLTACQRQSSVEVIAADGVLCDLTRRLAAADLRVDCLLDPDDDPHQFLLSPRQSREVQQARLVLINGYALTPALQKLPQAVAVAELAVPHSPASAKAEAESKAEAEQEHGHGHHSGDAHEQDHQHDHGGRDPHAWHDPLQAEAMVHVVSERLQELKPAAAAAIRQREQLMRQSLVALDRWNRRQFATLPAERGNRTLATGHRAFSSLARRYELTELPVVDAGSTSEALRPQALAAVVQRLKAEKIPALFSEQWPASKAITRISELSGVPLAPGSLRADGLASAPHDDLMATLTTNTCLIVDQLGGRCDRPGQRQLIAGWEAIR
jgi:ABC-type Zn uptake system ZnuABC Zn-binding protein ZnuA